MITIFMLYLIIFVIGIPFVCFLVEWIFNGYISIDSFISGLKAGHAVLLLIFVVIFIILACFYVLHAFPV